VAARAGCTGNVHASAGVKLAASIGETLIGQRTEEENREEQEQTQNESPCRAHTDLPFVGLELRPLPISGYRAQRNPSAALPDDVGMNPITSNTPGFASPPIAW
jgi:hypothetical protein